MKKTRLAKAIGLSLTGAVLSLAAVSNASAHVMYNTYNAYASDIGTDAADGGTDGWVSPGSWVGTSDGNSPFGFTGPVAHWAAQLHAVADSLVVSSADAHADYGVWADIDTAKGAWNDGKFTQSPASSGWSHNTDVGLLKSNVTQKVTLSASNIDSSSWQTFGITVFSGMSSSYSHHGGWNEGYTASNTDPATLIPLGMTNVTFVGYTDNSSITFTAQAGQVYTILLGGYSGSDNWGPHSGYAMNITSAPVPVPGAVWLFGSAMVGLIGFGKRKRVA